MADTNDPNDSKRSPDSDRRRAERVPINEEFGGLAGTNTWVSDLSEGGVFVHSRDRLAIGSSIQLRFTVLLQDPVVIEAVGTVVRHSEHPCGMGVAFEAISEDMAARIQAVLEHRRPRDTGTPLRKLAMPLAPLPADDYAARSLTREQFEHLTTGTPLPVSDDDEAGFNGSGALFQVEPKPAPAEPPERARQPVTSPRFAPPPRTTPRPSLDDD